MVGVIARETRGEYTRESCAPLVFSWHRHVREERRDAMSFPPDLLLQHLNRAIPRQ
jgi:hypothetical protein